MTIQELYVKIGGDFNDVLTRLSKDSLVERFALMYLSDGSFDILMKSVESGNISEEFRAAHSLKGVSANLGFTELSKAAAELTEQLRSQTGPADPSLPNTVIAAQKKVIDGLNEFKASK